MLLLKCILFADFLLDLFESFEEELFDFAALVDDNLRQGSHISQLLVFNAQVFAGVDYTFSLLFNDRLVLVADHFLFFLKVSDYLSQTLLQNLDLVLVCFDLIALKICPLLVLLLCSLIDRNVPLDFSILLFLLLNFALVFFQFVPLGDSL